jgi:hypothetical protein
MSIQKRIWQSRIQNLPDINEVGPSLKQPKKMGTVSQAKSYLRSYVLPAIEKETDLKTAIYYGKMVDEVFGGRSGHQDMKKMYKLMDMVKTKKIPKLPVYLLYVFSIDKDTRKGNQDLYDKLEKINNKGRKSEKSDRDAIEGLDGIDIAKRYA